MKDINQSRFWKYGIVSFLVLILLESIAYLGFLGNIPNFLLKYGWWIFYLDISVASLAVAIFYILSYKSKVPCMTGMMVGMTVGMQLGMMLGAVVGASSGFFTGAMVGMILGSIGGAIAGTTTKSTMGWLQGLMAGVMGGTMGPMITVMMFVDHLEIFMPFYIIINVIILFGLMRMYHEEVVVDNKELVHKHYDFMTFLSACIIVAFILLAIMVYGPKSALFSQLFV